MFFLVDFYDDIASLHVRLLVCFPMESEALEIWTTWMHIHRQTRLLLYDACALAIIAVCTFRHCRPSTPTSWASSLHLSDIAWCNLPDFNSCARTTTLGAPVHASCTTTIAERANNVLIIKNLAIGTSVDFFERDLHCISNIRSSTATTKAKVLTKHAPESLERIATTKSAWKTASTSAKSTCILTIKRSLTMRVVSFSLLSIRQNLICSRNLLEALLVSFTLTFWCLVWVISKRHALISFLDVLL
mmetsp:Transcript_56255/g.89292  ORF Transcript_56255/g.89292 Transcript_56255/m.89292 type:complete len:246 (+) Transcript_56255:548-1285(+)